MIENDGDEKTNSQTGCQGSFKPCLLPSPHPGPRSHKRVSLGAGGSRAGLPSEPIEVQQGDPWVAWEAQPVALSTVLARDGATELAQNPKSGESQEKKGPGIPLHPRRSEITTLFRNT